MRMTAWITALASALTLSLWQAPLDAATSSDSVFSPMGGNGHNVTFDGRVFIVRNGPDAPTGGWFATVLRPENIGFRADGLPRLNQGAFAPMTLIQPFEAGENALAICQPTATPVRCDEAGNPSATGPHACYDLQVIDSDATVVTGNTMRRRALKLWVSDPQTANAAVHKWEWGPTRDFLSSASGAELKGIEPTVTEDGKLLVWQGHPDNDGKIDVLMYATNQTACGLDGWDGPKNVGAMFTDPAVNGVYPLGERALRAADGTVYGPNDMLRGGYPWLFPDGEAINFTSVPLPCRDTEDPPGCGPRRGGFAVIGYPTNWSLAHIDGGVNPDTDQTVRLFFTSPGPDTFPQIPVTPGLDVWPMFGSNTQNYVELVFDDGLDGNYAGVWHMNEMVTRDGELDRGRTPDVSGYFNTGEVVGAVFPLRNNAPGGKALVFDGVGAHVRVPHSSTLDPVNAITIEMRLQLDADPNCDDANNYRYLIGKGNIGDGSYSIILEQDRHLQARVNVGGEQRALVSTMPLEVRQWSDIALRYDGATGEMSFTFDGAPAGEVTYAPGTLTGSTADLTIGGPGGVRDACPDGDGAFAGAIDEVRISRSDREPDPDPNPDPDMGVSTPDMGSPPDLDMGTTPVPDVGTAQPDLGTPTGPEPDTGSSPDDERPSSEVSLEGDGGCGCATTTSSPGGAMLLFLAMFALLRRRR